MAERNQALVEKISQKKDNGLNNKQREHLNALIHDYKQNDWLRTQI